MTEKEIIKNHLLPIIQAAGGRIWRTAPGTLWKGFLRSLKKGVAILEKVTPMKLFQVGEPDCHFFEQVKITPEMVGKKILRFGKAEIKTLGYKKVTVAQRRKLEFIARKGGRALIVFETKYGIEIEEIKP